MRKVLGVVVGLCVGLSAPQAFAQKKPAEASNIGSSILSQGPQKQVENTVGVISGNPGGTDLYAAYDMSAVLDDKDIRILPMVGRGAGQNVIDILKLRGVDAGVTQTDILNYFKKNGIGGSEIADRVYYITKLYNKELHILASDKINSIKELEGKAVNFGEIGSGADISGRLILDALGIKVQAMNVPQTDALIMIKEGKLAASMVVDGKPVNFFNTIKASDGVKLLGVPYAPALEDDYLPAERPADDYPGIVAANKPLETVAVGAVLAAYNWPKKTDRYDRVSKFVNALFDKHAEFQKSARHPKWKEVNLTALLVGWKRFPAAAEWLEGASQKAAAAAAAANKAPLAGAPRDENAALFQEFLEWRKKSGR